MYKILLKLYSLCSIIIFLHLKKTRLLLQTSIHLFLFIATVCTVLGMSYYFRVTSVLLSHRRSSPLSVISDSTQRYIISYSSSYNGSLWPSSYGSQIYIYLCNQCPFHKCFFSDCLLSPARYIRCNFIEFVYYLQQVDGYF